MSVYPETFVIEKSTGTQADSMAVWPSSTEDQMTKQILNE